MSADHDSIPPNPFGDMLGLRMTEAGQGRARAVLQVTGQLFNPHRVLHGAVIFALADNCMGAALYSQLGGGEFCSTIEIKINFVRPVSSGELVCDTTVVHKGKTTAVLESRVENGGKLAALAQGAYAILSRHPKS